MEFTTLSNTNIRVSRLCVGGEQIGGFGWGSYNVEDAVEAAAAAFDHGINFIDTADCYNLGESERRIGKLIADKRNQLIVSTKFGVVVREGQTPKVIYDNSPAYIEQAVAASLRRLNTDYIDLYQLHHRDTNTPLKAVLEYLESLVERGIIRSYGVSNTDIGDIDFNAYPNLATASFEYSLADRGVEHTVKQITDQNITFLSFGTLGQGVLSGKYTKDTTFGDTDRRSNPKYKNFHGLAFAKNLAIVEVLRKIANSIGDASPAQVALRWALQAQPSSTVIVGMKSSNQLLSNVGVFNFRLNPEQMSELDQVSQVTNKA